MSKNKPKKYLTPEMLKQKKEERARRKAELEKAEREAAMAAAARERNKRILVSAIALAIIIGIVACIVSCSMIKKNTEKKITETIGDGYCSYLETRDTDGHKLQYVKLAVKGYGSIILLLDETTAPITVKNFVKLVNEGFYDGLTFHRVMSGFMIQGGDPEANGTGGSSQTIKGEFASNGVENDISHKEGVISMARSDDMDSASSQFFICNADAASLDGSYAAFGYVIAGMSVVHDITEKSGVYANAYNNYIISDKSNQAVIEYAEVISEDAALKHVDIKTDIVGEGSCSYLASRNTDGHKLQYVKMSVVGYGSIILLLDETTAPITVKNFVKLANEGFYDGLTFHRVMSGFMIQGGDPEANGTGGSSQTIKGEFSSNGVENDISHKEGVISMARGDDMDSASSQFFICNADAASLDGSYAAFGYVIAGMSVVHDITDKTLVYANPSYSYTILDKGKQAVIKSVRVITAEEALSYTK